MVSDGLIPPSCLKFLADKLHHVTVILQLAWYLPILERVYDLEVYIVFDK